ncbi:MAG: pirin family protein [Candidatus Magnetoovum sp. WYHC-5]|nr:pirin family protein [Candidatus Magnetoovum sp. WYHC-5]
MAIEIRNGSERGYANYGWLETYHSFSFSTYYDPNHMQFGPLRVLNEDFVKPGTGFGTHPHQDMEVVSYVLAGGLAHKDSTGGESVVPAGEVQRMSAGTGIAHSEYNASDRDMVHFLQVWFIPDKKGYKPGYEQRNISDFDRNKLVAAVSNRDDLGALKINQDVVFYVCDLDSGNSVDATIEGKRLGYLHNAMFGKLKVNDILLEPGDGLRITGREVLKITAVTDSRFVLFDMGQ